VLPDVPLGTANAQLNVPCVVPVSNEPTVQPETITESKIKPTVLDKEKPFPETVTVVPTAPCPGATLIRGVVTVNPWAELRTAVVVSVPTIA